MSETLMLWIPALISSIGKGLKSRFSTSTSFFFKAFGLAAFLGVLGSSLTAFFFYAVFFFLEYPCSSINNNLFYKVRLALKNFNKVGCKY
jgi:hypothetical protein